MTNLVRTVVTEATEVLLAAAIAALVMAAFLAGILAQADPSGVRVRAEPLQCLTITAAERQGTILSPVSVLTRPAREATP